MSNNDLIKRIEAALEKIRPYLKADGGNVEFHSVTPDNVLKVKLTGACEGCPFSMFTMKAGVEQTILKEVPEIKEVVTV
jgi:Fe-S cluster biogenesis protein NfuA